MTGFVLYLLWAIGVSTFTLLGALYVRRYGKADLLVGLYTAFIIAAQILATKIAAFPVGDMTLIGPAGVLVFSVTFLLTDIVNEAFGRKATHKMIFIGFIAQVAVSFFLWLGTQFSPAPSWAENSDAWNGFFGMVPRIMLASWAAFLISENLDAALFAWLRRKTGERHLWLRNVLSTLPSLLVDSLIFIPLAFWGIPGVPLLVLIKGQTIAKWIVGIVNIPFMYLNHYVLCHGREEVCTLQAIEDHEARQNSSVSVS